MYLARYMAKDHVLGRDGPWDKMAVYNGSVGRHYWCSALCAVLHEAANIEALRVLDALLRMTDARRALTSILFARAE
jgi:hypothetical protein